MEQVIKAQVRGYVGRGVREAYIDEAGHLIFVMSDKTKLDLGEVIGPEGAPGVGIAGAYIDQDGHLKLKMSDGQEIDAGSVAAPVDNTLSIPGQAADAAETGKVKGVAWYASQRAEDAQTAADDAKLLAAEAKQKALSAEQTAENAGQMAADAERTAGEAKTRADEAYDLASQGGGGTGGGIHVGDDHPEEPNVAGWLRIREPSEVLVKAPIPAEVGQMLRVAAVDENGVPTKWEVVTPPQALPNPHALTFTGAVEGSYDGSAPMEIEIPAGGGGVTCRVTSITATEDATQYEIPLENMENSEIFGYVGDSGVSNKFKLILIFPEIGTSKYTRYEYTAGQLNSQYHHGRFRIRLMSIVDNANMRNVSGLTFNGPYYNSLDKTPRLIIQSESEGNPFPSGTKINLVEIYYALEVAE